jgi:hypothetical protein
VQGGAEYLRASRGGLALSGKVKIANISPKMLYIRLVEQLREKCDDISFVYYYLIEDAQDRGIEQLRKRGEQLGWMGTQAGPCDPPCHGPRRYWSRG